MSEITTHSKSADREPNGAKTPTVRGFFRRGAWKQRLDACGLPTETRALVASTVQATKLRAAEKLAVADELIAHFHDADRQGVEPAAARGAFGEPAVAAKLIRRAKKRNRGWFSRAWTGTKWTVLGLSVVYAAAAIRFHAGEPRVTTHHLAAINATASAVADDQRAWPELRDALLTMGFRHVADEVTAPDDLSASPGDEAWPALAAWASEHRSAMDRLAEASTRPGLGYLVGSSHTAEDERLIGEQEALAESVELGVALSNQILPQLGPLRTAGRAMRVDALLAAEQAQADRALRNLRAMGGLANHAKEVPVLVQALVAKSLHSLTLRTTAELLARTPNLFSEDQLAGLQRDVERFAVDLPAFVEGDSRLAQDLIQRMYTDDGSGSGRLAADPVEIQNLLMVGLGPQATSGPASRIGSLLGPVGMLLAPSRHEMEHAVAESTREASTALDTPLWERWQWADATGAGGPVWNANALVSAMLEAPIDGLRPSHFKTLALRDAALLALALHRHRLATGSFPAPSTGHSQMVPTHLDEVPLDPLHGTPLRWTLRDGRPVIYSLGADADDDGGVAPTDDLGGNDAAFAPPEEAVNGDWIAWPPSGLKPCSPCP